MSRSGVESRARRRHKLQPLLEGDNITVMKDSEFLDEEKRKNTEAGTH